MKKTAGLVLSIAVLFSFLSCGTKEQEINDEVSGISISLPEIIIDGCPDGGTIETDAEGTGYLAGTTEPGIPIYIYVTFDGGEGQTWVKSGDDGKFTYTLTEISPAAPVSIKISADATVTDDGQAILSDNPKFGFSATIVNPFDATEIEEATTSETAAVETVSDIELKGIEDGVAYYDVFLMDDVKWPDYGNDEDIAKESIRKCVALASGEEAIRIAVVGYKSGIQCFTWDGVDAVKYYDEEGKYTHEFFLTSSEVEEFSLK